MCYCTFSNDLGDQGDNGDQSDPGDWRYKDDQDEVSLIVFGMSESSRFQKNSLCWVF